MPSQQERESTLIEAARQIYRYVKANGRDVPVTINESDFKFLQKRKCINEVNDGHLLDGDIPVKKGPF